MEYSECDIVTILYFVIEFTNVETVEYIQRLRLEVLESCYSPEVCMGRRAASFVRSGVSLLSPFL